MKNSNVSVLSILFATYLNAAEKDNISVKNNDSTKSHTSSEITESKPYIGIRNLFNQFRDFTDDIGFFSQGFKFFDVPFYRTNINTIEDEDKYIVTFEIPGVDEKDIVLEFKNNNLILSCNRTLVIKNDKDHPHYQDDSMRSFNQSLQFPPIINPDAIDAKLKNGILTVTLKKDKSKSQPSKRIKINT